MFPRLVGIALVTVFTAYNLFVYIPTFLPTTKPDAGLTPDQQAIIFQHAETVHTRIAAGVSAGFLLGCVLLGFWVTNKPTNVDFLIATDSEMKKVNWTTQKELMGSTKIVIGFVFVMAVVLFCYDLFFQLIFYLLGVLKTPPFFIGH